MWILDKYYKSENLRDEIWDDETSDEYDTVLDDDLN